MIADIFRFQLDSVVIAGFIGLAAVTHYRVASVFMSYYIALVVSTTGMVQPVFSRLQGTQDHTAMEKILLFSTRISICISIFIAFGLIVWGRPFIARWMGPNYEDAYWPLVILSVAVFLDLGQNPSIALLYATFKHRFYTYLNCFEGLINLIVSLALAKPFGVAGVAMGTLVGAILSRVVVQPYLVCKVSGYHYGRYMKFLGATILRAGCIIALAFAIVTWALKPSYPWLAGSAICATVVYAAGAWFVVFKPGEREQLRAILMSGTRKKPDLSPVVATAR